MVADCAQNAACRLIILALSGPCSTRIATRCRKPALALVIDNDWPSAPDWPDRVATAQALIEQAGRNDGPVSLTLQPPVNDPVPTSAETAMTRLKAAEPRPLEADRKDRLRQPCTALRQPSPAHSHSFPAGKARRTRILQSWQRSSSPRNMALSIARSHVTAVTDVRNGIDNTEVTVTRPFAQGPQTLALDAMDEKGVC